MALYDEINRKIADQVGIGLPALDARTADLWAQEFERRRQQNLMAQESQRVALTSQSQQELQRQQLAGLAANQSAHLTQEHLLSQSDKRENERQMKVALARTYKPDISEKATLQEAEKAIQAGASKDIAMAQAKKAEIGQGMHAALTIPKERQDQYVNAQVASAVEQYIGSDKWQALYNAKEAKDGLTTQNLISIINKDLYPGWFGNKTKALELVKKAQADALVKLAQSDVQQSLMDPKKSVDFAKLQEQYKVWDKFESNHLERLANPEAAAAAFGLNGLTPMGTAAAPTAAIAPRASYNETVGAMGGSPVAPSPDPGRKFVVDKLSARPAAQPVVNSIEGIFPMVGRKVGGLVGPALDARDLALRAPAAAAHNAAALWFGGNPIQDPFTPDERAQMTAAFTGAPQLLGMGLANPNLIQQPAQPAQQQPFNPFFVPPVVQSPVLQALGSAFAPTVTQPSVASGNGPINPFFVPRPMQAFAPSIPQLTVPEASVYPPRNYFANPFLAPGGFPQQMLNQNPSLYNAPAFQYFPRGEPIRQ